LEYNDIEISTRKFKLKVRLPKPVVRYKEAISKEEIREILLKCSNIKLKTYLMLLVSTGMRHIKVRLKRGSGCCESTEAIHKSRQLRKIFYIDYLGILEDILFRTLFQRY
jgi:hypothetical protein